MKICENTEVLDSSNAIPHELPNKSVTNRSGTCWMSQREIHFLRRIMPLQGRVLEIGSASGVTISLLAEESPDVRFLSVDHYPVIAYSDTSRRACDNDATCYQNWIKNRRPNNFLFIGKLNDFHRFSCDRFDMAIVDGSHLYEDVLSDLLLTRTLILAGRPILCHDYHDPHWYQVTEAVDRFCAESEYKVTCTVGAMAVLEKP